MLTNRLTQEAIAIRFVVAIIVRIREQKFAVVAAAVTCSRRRGGRRLCKSLHPLLFLSILLLPLVIAADAADAVCVCVLYLIVVINYCFVVSLV